MVEGSSPPLFATCWVSATPVARHVPKSACCAAIPRWWLPWVTPCPSSGAIAAGSSPGPPKTSPATPRSTLCWMTSSARWRPAWISTVWRTPRCCTATPTVAAMSTSSWRGSTCKPASRTTRRRLAGKERMTRCAMPGTMRRAGPRRTIRRVRVRSPPAIAPWSTPPPFARRSRSSPIPSSWSPTTCCSACSPAISPTAPGSAKH